MGGQSRNVKHVVECKVLMQLTNVEKGDLNLEL